MVGRQGQVSVDYYPSKSREKKATQNAKRASENEYEVPKKHLAQRQMLPIERQEIHEDLDEATQTSVVSLVPSTLTDTTGQSTHERDAFLMTLGKLVDEQSRVINMLLDKISHMGEEFTSLKRGQEECQQSVKDLRIEFEARNNSAVITRFTPPTLTALVIPGTVRATTSKSERGGARST